MGIVRNCELDGWPEGHHTTHGDVFIALVAGLTAGPVYRGKAARSAGARVDTLVEIVRSVRVEQAHVDILAASHHERGSCGISG